MEKKCKNKKLYTGADLEQIFGITRKTLFYYDKSGLLKPIERIGQRKTKLYDETGYQQLKCIIQYREAGLKIEEIKMLINGENDERTQILENALTRLEKDFAIRQKEIENLKKLIEEYSEERKEILPVHQKTE
ncbi:MAG: MerR family transcriptional regulator [Solobacterium sp.]|nr:MerR family transcriptional regulator [Solobacterium sp.]